MNLGKGLWWVIKLLLVFAILAILAIFSRFVIPTIEYEPLYADTAAARVVYNGGFMSTPGVINPGLFTQDTADTHLLYDNTQIETRIYVIARVTDNQGNTLLGPIAYNKAAYQAYHPSHITNNFVVENRTLPATIDRGGTLTPALLNIEVWYG